MDPAVYRVVLQQWTVVPLGQKVNFYGVGVVAWHLQHLFDTAKTERSSRTFRSDFSALAR